MAIDGLSSVGGRTFFVCTLLFQSLAILAVGLRIWAKTILRRGYQPHDYLIFAALFFAISSAVDSILSVDSGPLGLHVPEAIKQLGPESLVVALKIFFASIFLWITATTLIKLSILHLYITIFNRPFFRAAAYTVAAIAVLFWTACVLLGLFFCRPLAFNWDKTIDGKCGDVTRQEIGSATVNMILDLSIVILPMPILWTLQLPSKKKIMLSGVLSLGLCICAMNITRIIFEATADAEDFTYSLTSAGLFSGLEVYIGITTACLPTFGPLLMREKLSYSARQAKANMPASRSSSGFRNPSKNNMNNRSYDLGTFDELGRDDDIPIREAGPHDGKFSGSTTVVRSYGDLSPSQSSRHAMLDGVINVKTDMQVRRSPMMEEC